MVYFKWAEFWHRTSFPRGTTRSFSGTLLRRWPGSDRVQNLHRGEHEFAGPQLPWLSARQFAIFFFADHKRPSRQSLELTQNRSPDSPPIIACRTNGIGGPPKDRKALWKAFQPARPPRDAVQSSRRFRIISLPMV